MYVRRFGFAAWLPSHNGNRYMKQKMVVVVVVMVRGRAHAVALKSTTWRRLLRPRLLVEASPPKPLCSLLRR